MNLLTKLEVATRVLSSVDAMRQTPEYRRLLERGVVIVPQLLSTLRSSPSIAVLALLHDITGQDPVAPQDRGYVQRMVDAWLKWGVDNAVDRRSH